MLYNDEDCVWVCVVCLYVSVCERERNRVCVCVCVWLRRRAPTSVDTAVVHDIVLRPRQVLQHPSNHHHHDLVTATS